MLEVKFYENADDNLLKFAVIIAKTDNKWVFCKHRERNTFEVPGGHREDGEVILETAKRELKEETGAVEFDIKPICVYSVKGKTRVNENLDDESFGMLYYAEIDSFEELHNSIYDGLKELKVIIHAPHSCFNVDTGNKELFAQNQEKVKSSPKRINKIGKFKQRHKV